MAVAIKLGTDIIWGTSSAGTLTSGKILSCDLDEDGKMYEQPDENGETYSVVFYDDTAEITVEVLAKTAGAPPARGSVATVAGITGAYVLKSKTMWKSGDTKKFSITFKKWIA